MLISTVAENWGLCRISALVSCSVPRACAAAAVGVALVRRCFPFGAPGTAVFGHPSLRYFEVAILPAAVAEEGKRQQAQLSQQRDDQLVAQQAQQQRERPCGVSVGLVESAQALGMLSNGLHLGWYSFAGSGSMQVQRPAGLLLRICLGGRAVQAFAGCAPGCGHFVSTTQSPLRCIVLRQSVGYHGEAGRLFPGPADSRWAWDGAPFAPSFGPGDVVGCGVDLAAGLAFFTLNGAVVGAVVPGGAGTPPGELPGGFPFCNTMCQFFLCSCVCNCIAMWWGGSLCNDVPPSPPVPHSTSAVHRPYTGWLRGAPVRPVQALTLRRSQLAVGLQRRGDRVALNLGQERFRFDLGQCCCSG